MKSASFLAFSALVLSSVLTGCLAQAAQPAAQSLTARESMFNRDWRYLQGAHPEAIKPQMDDSAWQAIGLPHSFSIPYFARGFYVGEGWYRKSFDAPTAWDGKQVHLVFGAAFQHCVVYLNGQEVGKHNGGYTSFDVNLTPALKVGANVLSVKLDNKWDGGLAPRAGEHVFSGGLYRDVKLVVTDALRIPHNGLTITTPEVSKEKATVQVVTTLVNNGKTNRSCKVWVQVLAPDKTTVVAQSLAPQTVPAGQSVLVSQTTPAIVNPQLWHPDHPFLYTTRVTVLEEGKQIDQVDTKTGLRWFKFTADKGFFLNGEHLRLQGANVHQDHAGWGDAVTDAGAWRDVHLMKEAGFNFIRGSHYPHSEAFINACDEQGILFWSEFCYWGIGGFGGDGFWRCSAYPPNPAQRKPFEESCLRGLEEMIADAKNHSSVFLWSMSNEPFFTAGFRNTRNFSAKGAGGGLMALARDLASAMVKRSHELDPTRLATVGGAQRAGFDKLGDVASYNGDGASAPNPGIPSIVSEYGSQVDMRPGVYAPFWSTLENTTNPIKPEWRCGEAIWCGFHHGSIAGKRFGSMGMVDYFRLPLRSWYWYRNAYAHVPPPVWPVAGTPAKMQLTADHLSITNDGTQDSHVVVSILDKDGKRITNSPRVKFIIVSGPGEFPTGSRITFMPKSDIDIRDGQAAIEFRSYYAGKTIIKATSYGLPNATLEITTTGNEKWTKDLEKARKELVYGATVVKRAATRDNIAFLRPTFASSYEAQHVPSDANDGNPKSRWCALTGTLPAWWKVDLENFYSVTQVTITFEKALNYRYNIEVSDDGKTWVMAAEKAENHNQQVRVEKFAKPVKGRFLRITYLATPLKTYPGHYEVEVKGEMQKDEDSE